MTGPRTVVVAGSGAELGRALCAATFPSDWTLSAVEPVSNTDLPVGESIHVEAADPDARLISVAAEADAVLLVAGIGPADASVHDARVLDLLLGCMRPGALLVALTSLAVFGDAGHHPVTETDTPHVPSEFDPTGAVERRVLTAGDWLRTVVVRPGLVYGPGGGPLLGPAIELASTQGVSRYFGSETDTLPTIHERDLGTLLSAIIADPRASGIYHAATGAVSVQGLAHLIAAAANVSDVAPWDLDSVASVLGTAQMVPRVNVTSAGVLGRASSELAWTPDAATLRDCLIAP